MTRKIKKFLFGLIGCLMAVLFAFETPVSIMATSMELENWENLPAEVLINSSANKKTYYVSDVRIGSYSNLIANGYIVDKESATNRYYDEDDNLCYNGEMSDVNGYGYCIGYKLTENKADAIYDISVMDMYGEYSELTYRDVLVEEQQNMLAVAQRIQKVARALEKNYDAGSTYAKLAVEILNHFTITVDRSDDEDKYSFTYSLGDYLIGKSTTRELQDFLDLVFLATTHTTAMVYNQLSMGVFDDLSKKGATSWIERLCMVGPLTILDDDGNVMTDDGELNSYYAENGLDIEYLDKAKEIYIVVKKFIDSYVEAKSRFDPNTAITTDTVQTAEKVNDGQVGDREGNFESFTETEESKANEVNDLMYIALFEALNAKKTTVIEPDLVELQTILDDNDCLTVEDYLGMCWAYVSDNLWTEAQYREEENRIDLLQNGKTVDEPVYPYGTKADGTQRSVAEFLLEACTVDETKLIYANDLYRPFYTFVMENEDGIVPLTEEQESMFYISGFNNAITLGIDTLDIAKMREECTKEMNDLKKDVGVSQISIYYDVDASLLKSFNEGTNVYWTNKAARITGASGRYDLLTQVVNKDEETALDRVEKGIKWCQMLSGVIGGISTIISAIMSGFVLGSGVTTTAVCVAFFTGQAAAFSGAVITFSVIATGAMWLSILATTVLVILLIVKWFMKNCKKPDYTLQYSDIPTCIYDYNDNIVLSGAAIKYYPIQSCGVETPESNNIFSYYRNVRCLPWTCLYYTKDPNAAEEPITVEYVDGVKTTIPFVSYVSGTFFCDNDTSLSQMQYNEMKEQYCVRFDRYMCWIETKDYSGSAIDGIEGCEAFSTVEGGDGYTPIHEFDAIEAYNFASYSTYDYHYGKTQRLKDIGDNTTMMKWYMHRPNTNKNPDDSDNIYIDDIILSSSENDEIARKKIIGKGYTLIDVNLTPSSKYYSYIGYSATSLRDSAIVDLRWAYCPGVDLKNAGKLEFSGATYVSSGCIGQLGLFYTKNSSNGSTAGTPILINGPTSEENPNGKKGAGLIVTDQTLGDGYEPVNLFCGGPAFDVDNCGSWTIDFDDEGKCTAKASEDWNYWGKRMYVYFYPETTFTDGPEYLGGLSFFSGREDGNDHMILWYMDDMGWDLLSSTDISGHTYIMNINKTYLAYSTTHNPYRAIYGIAHYTAQNGSSGMQYCIQAGSAGTYAVCEVFQQGGEGFVKYCERSMRMSHAYRTGSYWDGAMSDGSIRYSVGNGYVNTKDETYGNDINGYAREAYTLSDGYSVAYREVTKAGLYVVSNTSADISNAKPILASELYTSGSKKYDSNTTTPVRSLTDWYSDEPVNLGYTEAYNSGVYYIFKDSYIDYDDVFEEDEIDNPDGTNMEDNYDDGWYYIDEDLVDDGSFNLYKDEHLYLFIQRPDTKRPFYVSQVKVSYAGNNGYTGTDNNEMLNDLISRSPQDEVILELIANGPGTLIRINLTGSTCDIDSDYYENCTDIRTRCNHVISYDSDANRYNIPYDIEIGSRNDDVPLCYSWYNRYNIPFLKYWRSDEIAYVWITYTNSTIEGVLSDIRILETEDYIYERDGVDDKIIVNTGAEAQICGDTFKWRDKYYTLYAIYGLTNQVTDLTISKDVFVHDDWTACGTDGQSSSYTEYFFHMKQYKNFLAKNYISITSIVLGRGGTAMDAQLNLLDLGCRSCFPVNLKSGEGGGVYLGYKTDSASSTALSNVIIQNNGQDDTVMKMRIGTEEYVRMASGLNFGVYDSLIDFYGTTNAARAKQSTLKTGRYLTGLIFWTDPDFWQLFTGTTQEAEAKVEEYLSHLSAEDREYLEYYLYNYKTGTKQLTKFSAVTDVYGNVINCNYSSNNFISKSSTGNEVYVFACYSDNTIRTPKSLVGSLFEDSSAVEIIAVTSGILVLAAVVVTIAKKRRKKLNKEA